MNIYNITIMMTMLICVMILVIAIIRLRLLVCNRKSRLKYTLIVSAALMGIGQPVISDMWPGVAMLCLAIIFLIVLVLGVPPLRAYKDNNDFFETNIYDPSEDGEEL